MEKHLKRTWAEVDLDAISHNYRGIRSLLPSKTKIMAVVKADAYGHGAEAVAKELANAGADAFAVSNFDEAAQLRALGISKPILILGYTPECFAAELAGLDITQTVCGFEGARALDEAAAAAGVRLRVHIKLDTGMSRLGISCQREEDIPSAAREGCDIASLPRLDVEGAFTHFASADEPDDRFTMRQYGLFLSVLEEMRKNGLEIRKRHCQNSAGILAHPDMGMDLARPGIILYGMYPDSLEKSSMADILPLRPAMALKSSLAQVKKVPAGATVSYGRTFRADAPATLAVIPIGYADGFIRRYQDSAEVLLRGKRVRITGRVCMDMCMADVTGIDAAPGDEVTVFGPGAPIERLAAAAGTINYEITCLVGKRVPRIYLRSGEICGYKNSI